MDKIQEFEYKGASNYELFMHILESVVSDKTPKLMRIALMAVIHECINSPSLKKTKQYQYFLTNSGIEDAETYYNAARSILDKSGLLNAKGNITLSVYREALVGPVHHVSKNQAVMWRSATHGQLEMLPHMSKQMGAALAERNMPDVYTSLNGMQQVGFRFNKVIKTIPDWNYKMPSHQWGYLEGAEFNDYKGKVHFHQTFDFRGRMYYRGPFNPSNTGDLGKAMFKFAESKPLGKSGYKALQMYIAELAGIKGSITKRVAWTEANALDLWSKIEGQKQNTIREITGVKKIFMLYVALEDYAKAQRSKQHYRSALIIKQDGSCNGVQHIAALLRDKATAQAVNLCSASEDDMPCDLYQDYADALKAVLPSEWHVACVRSLGKQPVMVSTYGAGDSTVTRELADSLSDHPELFAKFTAPDSPYPDLFLTVLKEVIAPVMQFILAVKASLKDYGKSQVTWLTPDRFPVRMQPNIMESVCYDDLVFKRDPEFGKMLSGIRVRNSEPAQLNVEAVQTKLEMSLPVNLIHSLDATHVRMTAKAAISEGMSFMHTHDEYGCHAADFFRLNMIIREQFVALHNQDVLASLCNRNGLDIQLRQGDYDINDALSATYMFS